MSALFQRATEVYAEVYFLAIIAASLLEWAAPNRPSADTVRVRWVNNLGLSILNAVLLRALFPILSVGWAALCGARSWGLFNHVSWPSWITVVISLAGLDLIYYGQHYAMHRVPMLWRVHRTHHTDHEYDFTTGVRAHPTESILTNLMIFAGIFVMGAPPLAVFLNQLLSIVLSLIGHANTRLPLALDRVLRLVLVTPDMHRVHHSRDIREGESNFSNLFPWWDHIFATYRDQPAAGHQRMTFGVTGFGARRHLTLPWMLAQPFLREDSIRQADLPEKGRDLAQTE